VTSHWIQSARALTFAALLIPSVAAVDGAPPRYFHMKAVQVIDKAGFAKPIPAMDLLIPAGWTFDGKVEWANRGCFTDLAAISFHMQSPDGKIVIEGYPSFSWQFVDNPSVQRYLVAENQQGLKVGLKPCPVNQPVPAATVLTKIIVPHLRPGKTIAAMETSADLDQFIKDRTAEMQAHVAKTNQSLQLRADEARARLKYDVDGAPVEEWISAVSMAQTSPSGDGRGGRRYDNRAIMIMSMRAPAGQLEANERLLAAVRGSIHLDQDWGAQFLSMVDKLNTAQQQQRAARDQIIRQFQQDEIAAINGVVANSQRGSDQAVAAESQYLRGVETYRDPSTGKQYELDNKYGNAWMNSNGSDVILSDDPNLNPSSVQTGSWTPMEHVQASP
jgi:hypothetical protein